MPIGRAPILLLSFSLVLLISFAFFFDSRVSSALHLRTQFVDQSLLPAKPSGADVVNAVMASASVVVVHIVLIKFKEDLTSEAVKPICDAFFKLKDQCIHPETKKPYIKSIKGGIDNSMEQAQKGNTHAFVLEFSAIWDRDYYVEKDPAHQAFKVFLESGGLESVTVVDFQDGVY